MNPDVRTGRIPLLDSGADPWIVRHNGDFLYCHSRDNQIWVRRAPTLDALAEIESVAVWKGPEGGRFSQELWAPELHAVDGGWVIYVAADDGDNANHRMVALVRDHPDPLGLFTFHGPLALEPDRWAIDGTLLRHPQHGLFFLWSGWEGTENVAQHLYVCPMADPLTPSGPRVRISSPDFDWEQRGAGGPNQLPTINEGPQVLQRGRWFHVVYSAAGSWSDDYCLGMLSLRPGGDPLDPTQWVKLPDPVFARTESILAPGHASFTTDPDGTDWIAYHSARFAGAAW
ncbi:MAG: glycoside hydrolase family 43 protein, partial [Armatimonadaceae bacterium]